MPFKCNLQRYVEVQSDGSRLGSGRVYLDAAGVGSADRRSVKFGGAAPRCVFGDASAMTSARWKRHDRAESLWSVVGLCRLNQVDP